jgi:ribosomal protein S18
MVSLAELQQEHEKRIRQLKNADPEQVGFLKRKIATIEDEIRSLEAVDYNKPEQLKSFDLVINGKKLNFNKAGVAKLEYNSILKRVDQKNYIVMYGSSTAKDAEVTYNDGKWNITCCDLGSHPEFQYEELSLAIVFALEHMHDKYSATATPEIYSEVEAEDVNLDLDELQEQIDEGGISIVPEEDEIKPKKKSKKSSTEFEDIDELKRYLTILQEIKETSKSKIALRQIDEEIFEVQAMINEIS